MDVEGAEWESLRNMLKSNVLARVKQLGMEIHVKPNSSRLYMYWTVLHQLEEQGFRRWRWTINFYNIYTVSTGTRSHCYEMVYINVNFLHKDLN